IRHLIFNNSNINKMKLRLAAGQVDNAEGAGAAGVGNEDEGDDLPDEDINMDDLFDEIDSKSEDDPDFEPSDFNSRLSA
ncbi:hypothetical protein PJP10_32790, partial [Mycobacterium kansasii]